MTERRGFATRIGVILATAGSAVGLGNVWRFPYVTGQNGGATFILLLKSLQILFIVDPVFLERRYDGRAGALEYRRFAHCCLLFDLDFCTVYGERERDIRPTIEIIPRI